MVAYNYVTCACHSSQWSTPMDSISTVHSITACSLCSLCWCGNHRSTGMVLPSPLIACPLIAIMNTCWIIVRDIDIEISQNDLKHMASDRTNKHLESLSSYLLYPSKTTSDQNPPANSWQSSSKKSIYIYIYISLDFAWRLFLVHPQTLGDFNPLRLESNTVKYEILNKIAVIWTATSFLFRVLWFNRNYCSSCFHSVLSVFSHRCLMVVQTEGYRRGIKLMGLDDL